MPYRCINPTCRNFGKNLGEILARCPVCRNILQIYPVRPAPTPPRALGVVHHASTASRALGMQHHTSVASSPTPTLQTISSAVTPQIAAAGPAAILSKPRNPRGHKAHPCYHPKCQTTVKAATKPYCKTHKNRPRVSEPSVAPDVVSEGDSDSDTVTKVFRSLRVDEYPLLGLFAPAGFDASIEATTHIREGSNPNYVSGWISMSRSIKVTSAWGAKWVQEHRLPLLHFGVVAEIFNPQGLIIRPEEISDPTLAKERVHDFSDAAVFKQHFGKMQAGQKAMAARSSQEVLIYARIPAQRISAIHIVWNLTTEEGFTELKSRLASRDRLPPGLNLIRSRAEQGERHYIAPTMRFPIHSCSSIAAACQQMMRSESKVDFAHPSVAHQSWMDARALTGGRFLTPSQEKILRLFSIVTGKQIECYCPGVSRPFIFNERRTPLSHPTTIFDVISFAVHSDTQVYYVTVGLNRHMPAPLNRLVPPLTPPQVRPSGIPAPSRPHPESLHMPQAKKQRLSPSEPG